MHPHFMYRHHFFVPYVWGPAWRPVGYFTPTVPPTTVVINIDNRQYSYNDGVFFAPRDNGFEVVPAPIGATVASLPSDRTRVMVGNTPYYYYGGVFYTQENNQFRVVPAPPGAIVTQLPEGTEEMEFDGITFLEFNGTFFQPITHNGQNAYVVVDTEPIE